MIYLNTNFILLEIKRPCNTHSIIHNTTNSSKIVDTLKSALLISEKLLSLKFKILY